MLSCPQSVRPSGWFAADRVLLQLAGAAAITVAIWLLSLAVLRPQPTVQTVVPAFDTDIDRYVALRRRAEDAGPVMRVTSDPTEIFEREQALALAIQAARGNVRQGNIFAGDTVADFRRLIAADLKQRSPAEVTALAADVAATAPRVNALYPRSLSLPTFPPRLLAALPGLPDGLEYRFMAGALIIRDTNANLIVDYLPEVLTP
jgi:hypothetical protein